MMRLARIVLVCAVIGLGGCGSSSTSGGTVDGLRYNLGGARTLSVPEADLATFGRATDLSYADWFIDDTAYSVKGADPRVILVLRLKAGVSDDAGPLGDFMVLTRGNDAEKSICKYFDASQGPIPAACGSG